MLLRLTMGQTSKHDVRLKVPDQKYNQSINQSVNIHTKVFCPPMCFLFLCSESCSTGDPLFLVQNECDSSPFDHPSVLMMDPSIMMDQELCEIPIFYFTVQLAPLRGYIPHTQICMDKLIIDKETETLRYKISTKITSAHARVLVCKSGQS